MAVDDRTSHAGLPLPHASNAMVQDVLRLRSAFSLIDAALEVLDDRLGGLDSVVASDDPALDTVQKLVSAVKQLRQDNSDLLELLEEKAGIDDLDTITSSISELSDSVASLSASVDSLSLEHEETQTLTDGQTVVNLASLPSTSGCAVYIEGVRLKKSEWTAHESVQTRLTLSKIYPAGHSITVVRRQGGV